MFISRWLIQFFVNANVESGRRLSDCMDARLRDILAAKQTEVDFLKAQIEGLTKRVEYERARADQLADRLLVKEARVAPVTPMAIAAATAAMAQDNRIFAEIGKAFTSMNDVGEDHGDVQHVKVEFAGGGSAIVGDSIQEPGR